MLIVRKVNMEIVCNVRNITFNITHSTGAGGIHNVQFILSYIDKPPAGTLSFENCTHEKKIKFATLIKCYVATS